MKNFLLEEIYLEKDVTLILYKGNKYTGKLKKADKEHLEREGLTPSLANNEYFVESDGEASPVFRSSQVKAIEENGTCKNPLILTLKKQWFDMILSGEKTEEYREIKPYWEKRFEKYFGKHKDFSNSEDFLRNEHKKIIIFKNGYRNDSPQFTAECTISEGTGREEWGAVKGEKYYILTIHRILDAKNDKIQLKDEKIATLREQVKKLEDDKKRLIVKLVDYEELKSENEWLKKQLAKR